MATITWLRVILSSALRYAPYTASCTPGYFNAEGSSPSNLLAALRSAPYLGSALDWARMLEAWRVDGSMRGLKVD
jgi:cyclohexanone monooxygenase